MKHNRTLVFAAFLLITIAISGCKKDDEGSDCGGDLTLNPEFASNTVQFNLDGAFTSYPHTGYNSSLWPDRSFRLTTSMWGLNDSAEILITIFSPADSFSYYRNLRSGTVQFNSPYAPPTTRAALISVETDAGSFTTLGVDNTDGTFEILNRGAIVLENGDSVVTVEGIFCCNVRSSPDSALFPLHGNFSGRFLVE